jgi:hypothetical protein
MANFPFRYINPYKQRHPFMAIRYYFLLRHEHRYKPPGIQDPSAGALVLGNLFMFMVAHLLIETELYEPILGKMRQKTNGRSRHVTPRHALSFLQPLDIHAVHTQSATSPLCARAKPFARGVQLQRIYRGLTPTRYTGLRASGGWTDFSAVHH